MLRQHTGTEKQIFLEKKGMVVKMKTRRAFLTGFLMTLICCSFVLFSTLAIWNTAMDMYGTNVPLLEVETDRELPQLNVTVLNTEYEVELYGLNEAARIGQKYYPLVPHTVRAAGYLLEGLESGVNYLTSPKSGIGDKLFIRADNEKKAVG